MDIEVLFTSIEVPEIRQATTRSYFSNLDPLFTVNGLECERIGTDQTCETDQAIGEFLGKYFGPIVQIGVHTLPLTRPIKIDFLPQAVVLLPVIP
ncbi:hypothetical protein H072_11319 [Dactylellina haptotyla CBS 200.50]|uniref:Uncharacterized protein n=1 Tax=Dactylellina haptotyla (strain CBS 200.50) TaxID=1284197 RepID=S7ZY39_DACHA|nr:hypothetical protein H072_11319 [Dactylellina haptotyla CBS 200.50]